MNTVITGLGIIGILSFFTDRPDKMSKCITEVDSNRAKYGQVTTRTEAIEYCRQHFSKDEQ